MAAFEQQEYQDRISAVKTLMQQRGVDTLWVTCPPNMNYLTGYDAWSFYVHQGVIISLDLDAPIWIGRHIDASAARLTSIVNSDDIVPYDETYVTGDKHPMEFVADVFKKHRLDKGVLGVEMDTHYYTAQAHAVLVAALPNASFEDADRLVNWVRIIKSPAELKYQTQAGEITDIAMQAAIDTIQVGTRQCDVAGVIFKNLISGHPDYYGDMPDYQTLPMGERTSAPHLTWTDEAFTAGSACTLELGANRYRYHAPLARTVVVGAVQDRLSNTAAYVNDGLHAALHAVKPGVRACDIEAAWRKSTEPHGIVKESRIGYSVGLGYPPDWGERTISLAPNDQHVLKENMVFHLMLGIWEEDCGYEISETFYVTKSGAECLSKMPRQLVVIDG